MDPVPRATRSRAPSAGAPHAGSAVDPSAVDASAVNHARYLVVLALGAFALPALARTLEALGAPRAPAGVSALLLAVVLIVAILVDRPGAGPAPAARGAARAPAERAATKREDSGARL